VIILAGSSLMLRALSKSSGTIGNLTIDNGVINHHAEIHSTTLPLVGKPDVQNSAALLPDLSDADFLEPCQSLDYGCRVHREGMQ
jgi:hypothetical protein